MYIVQLRRRGLLSLRWKTVKRVLPDLNTAEQTALYRRLRHWKGPFQGVETRIVSVL